MRPLDIAFTEIGADFIRAAMPVDARTRQPYGLLHGGASVALAETVGSTGANMCVDPGALPVRRTGDQRQSSARGHAAGAWSGRRGPMHIGGRSQVWGIEIVNEAGRAGLRFAAHHGGPRRAPARP